MGRFPSESGPWFFDPFIVFEYKKTMTRNCGPRVSASNADIVLPAAVKRIQEHIPADAVPPGLKKC